MYKVCDEHEPVLSNKYFIVHDLKQAIHWGKDVYSVK